MNIKPIMRRPIFPEKNAEESLNKVFLEILVKGALLLPVILLVSSKLTGKVETPDRQLDKAEY